MKQMPNCSVFTHAKFLLFKFGKMNTLIFNSLFLKRYGNKRNRPLTRIIIYNYYTYCTSKLNFSKDGSRLISSSPVSYISIYFYLLRYTLPGFSFNNVLCFFTIFYLVVIEQNQQKHQQQQQQKQQQQQSIRLT